MRSRVVFLVFAVALCLAVDARAEIAVQLESTVEFPVAVGSNVWWVAKAEGAGDSEIWYRYRARRIGRSFETIRDFGPDANLQWAQSDREGWYEVEVTARERNSREETRATRMFEITSRVVDGQPVVSPTDNALVYLYSAAACGSGERMRVEFAGTDGVWTSTPWKTCRPGVSMNFYLAGLRENSAYRARHVLDTLTETARSEEVSFQTGQSPLPFGAYNVITAPQGNSTHPFLLHSNLFSNLAATDLAGNGVWYYSGTLGSVTGMGSGGRLIGLGGGSTLDAATHVVRVIDLAGYTLKETNAARVNEQLEAMGKRKITGFHHDARIIPEGRIMVLASTEQLMTGVQGPGEVDVIGDSIVVLDEELRVVWVWDSFEHLDATRMATLAETCLPVGSGCPPFHLAAIANDWLHGNAIQFTSDGNIVYSARHQDWLIKIHYDGGEGDGAVLWRLGKGGDFTPVSGDPYPWFSHQHDGTLYSDGMLTVFDNANMIRESNSNAHSRGQMWKLAESNRTATLVLNADLGYYAFALGSAQRLSDSAFHFNAGWVQDLNTARSIEVNSSGSTVYSLQGTRPEYRSYRLKDMYSPPY